MSSFWRRIINSKDPDSAKRVVTLIMAAHFIATSFIVTFFAFYLIIYTPKGSVNKDLLVLLTTIMEQDFYIILAGLGIIGVENVANIMLEKAKAKVAGNIAVGAPTADTINVQKLDVKQTIVPKDTPPIEPEPPQ